MTEMSDELRAAVQAALRRQADDLVRRAYAAAPIRPMPGCVLPEPDADGVYRITNLPHHPRKPETGTSSTLEGPA
ncbi:hypothetical protein [Nocardioides soli]|uniref:Uncharacterized protein n=1 Tax=Nocardioides soli TaxID=1036020 RepID=A0A7W4VTH5_9ACTN|nr:hypothetical protein [Nocardioides soli]MBB3041203.1 hypothetical protein [Nocardioides soli]